MLGLRTLVAATVLASSMFGLCAAQTATGTSESGAPGGTGYKQPTPPDGYESPETMCVLTGFSFTPPMTITPAFDMSTHTDGQAERSTATLHPLRRSWSCPFCVCA